MLQKFVFVASPSFFILSTLSCIFATSHVFIRKIYANFYENADGYFDYLTSVQVWNNPRAMYMDKENTLWKLSCPSYAGKASEMSCGVQTV